MSIVQYGLRRSIFYIVESQKRLKSLDERRCLIVDSYGSHTLCRILKQCLDNKINILLLPPHCSNLLQPLDVGVYGPLKRYYASEFDS